MKSHLLRIITTVVFFTSINTLSASNRIEISKILDIDFEGYDLKDSLSEDLTISELIVQINKYTKTDLAKLSILLGWYFDNFDFDLNKFHNGGIKEHYSDIYSRKAGTCGDFSYLFAELCNRLNIQNYVIEGYAPELSAKSVYKETNHAWNVVYVNGYWLHCDVMGACGVLHVKADSSYTFKKRLNLLNYLTFKDSFIAKHIPADPMWQLSEYPRSIENLIANGNDCLHDSTQVKFNYKDSINCYIKLPKNKQILKTADNTFEYNRNNHNAIIVNYYNAVVDLVNSNSQSKDNLVLAKRYLIHIRKHLPYAYDQVKALSPHVDQAYDYVIKYVP